MERKRWDKAIRCLEVALHPNTADDEVIAGVNGFRRTVAGTPLSEVCAEFAGASSDPGLSRENLDLRRKLEEEHIEQLAALRRLQEAERLIREMSEEIRAEQQSFADFRAASAQIVDGLQDQNFDLRGALEQARLAAQRPAPFRDLLAAALGEESAVASPDVPPAPRHPWTA